jgi:hypothetical protein
VGQNVGSRKDRKIETDDQELGTGEHRTLEATRLLARRDRYGNAVDWHPAHR